MLVIHDTHLGPHRTGGTTPLSYALLVNYSHEKFEELLDQAVGLADRTVMVLGDLFDGFEVSNNVLVRTFSALHERLRKGHIKRLLLVRGNHDISKDTTKLSSFDVLCHMLTETCSGADYEVEAITEPTEIVWGEHLDVRGIVIPHVPNQDLFDQTIAEVIAAQPEVLFVHCNYDNHFAVESDHSLNLSKEQAKALHDAGVKRIYFAHEHQQRAEMGGVVQVMGNQFPTSIADCLGNDTKRMLLLDGYNAQYIETWRDKGSYVEVEWTKADSVSPDAQFIRVKGEATDEQAAAVIDAVAKLRKRHNAFVVTNAVVIDGRALDASALEAVEQVERFDVIKLICDNLKPEQVEVVRALAAQRQKETEDA